MDSLATDATSGLVEVGGPADGVAPLSTDSLAEAAISGEASLAPALVGSTADAAGVVTASLVEATSGVLDVSAVSAMVGDAAGVAAFASGIALVSALSLAGDGLTSGCTGGCAAAT